MSIIKKIFFFCLFLFFLSVLFWLVYFFSFKEDTPPEIPEDIPVITELPETTPTNQSEKITTVFDDIAISPVFSSQKKVLQYYSKGDNQLMEASVLGKNKKSLSDKIISDVVGVYWSLDKSKVILKTKNSQGIYANTFYDFEKGTTQELSANIYNIAWQTNADRIFYEYFDRSKNVRSLSVSDPDGKNWTVLTTIPSGQSSFYQVPGVGLLSFWNSGDSFMQTKLQIIPLVGGEVKTIFENGFGADYLWDKSGDHILVSQSDVRGGYKMRLAVMNSKGGEYNNLDIPTFITKCAWSKDGKTIYYALPGGIPEKSILPNDYKNGKFKTADTFWKVDIETGKKERLLETDEITGTYDTKNIFLNEDESLLFFVNKIDDKLYKISL
jgi:hypothetical protein